MSKSDKNREDIEFIIIRNQSNGQTTPSYDIRIAPLKKFLLENKYKIIEMDLKEFLRNPISTDVIMIQRFVTEDKKNRSKFLTAALDEIRNSCKTLIWDVDDNLFELVSNNDQENELKGFLAKLYDVSDLITVSTQTLLLDNKIAKKAFLLPNYPSKKIKKVAYLRGFRAVKFGYLGNFDRNLDILSCIEILAATFPGRRLKLYTYQIPVKLEIFIKSRVQNIEIENYPSMPYQLILKHYSKLKLHFSIAPLSQSKFNTAKSAIKYIDYSTNKAPILISDVGEISEILSRFKLVPPMNDEHCSENWASQLKLLMNRDINYLALEKAKRQDFFKVRNQREQINDFERYLYLILQRTVV